MSKEFPTPGNFEERFSIELLKRDIRSLLLGGVACLTYGSTRFTKDTDWWLDSTMGIPAWVKRLMEVANGCEMPCEWTRLRGNQNLGSFPKDVGSGSLSVRVEEAVREDSMVRIGTMESFVDVFYQPHRLSDFQAAWERSCEFDGCLRRLSIADLIESKLDTARHQDEEDIRYLRSLKKE